MINKTRMKLIEDGEYEIINPNTGEKTKQEEI